MLLGLDLEYIFDRKRPNNFSAKSRRLEHPRKHLDCSSLEVVGKATHDRFDTKLPSGIHVSVSSNKDRSISSLKSSSCDHANAHRDVTRLQVTSSVELRRPSMISSPEDGCLLSSAEL